MRLDSAATDVELTASTRAAMQRYTFPPTPQANLIVDVSRSVDGVAEGSFQVTGPDEISGWVKSRYPVYFVARFSRPFAASGTFKAEGEGAGGWVSFDTTSGAHRHDARRHLVRGPATARGRTWTPRRPTFDFDAMRRGRPRGLEPRARRACEVSGGSDLDTRSFYTALYHAQLHPNVFTDVDGRYRGFDDPIHHAGARTQYANFSLWDLYKSQNQLLALIQPRALPRDAALAAGRPPQGGKLPRWGEQNIDAAHMSGDPAIPAIADGRLPRAARPPSRPRPCTAPRPT